MKTKKKSPKSGTTSGYRNVGRPLNTRQGAPAKLNPIQPKNVPNNEGMKAVINLPKEPQRSNVTIPAPEKKKRKLRLRRK